MKTWIYTITMMIASLSLAMTLQAKEVTKNNGEKVSMCYTHVKKWHPCAVQASK